MTREEDFKEEGRIAVNKYARELGDYTFGEGSMVEMFVLGANYADQHPKKGLWDAEKICSFIEENIDNYLYINRDWNAPQIKSNFIEDLKKAMEES